ncbi:FtsZ-interacting cell division protein ZipA [Sphingobium sp. B7D2B]|uniref:hypothetical protein n=1 Tax=unclassified Sphingobium TaxID=2611147 RepID=UPI0022244438|nr:MULTISPECIES: hypothetical protein [unclassified Sphingobium]MCW2349261.1 FtsZ-interacting cell division protein ZipA [Sphingobium sp. B12D2B]MCW2367563.1 FtsZ-interacting cell division protein ZipA [Sphingobium sp. B7D2B]MCW2368363.1 FtsZ-interacting cell division protein ZipA [Sphingobium sp. B11D3D]
MGSLWSLMTVVGPVLFAAVLVYAIWRNKRDTKPGDEARSDRAAKDLRDSLDREDKRRDRKEPYSTRA